MASVDDPAIDDIGTFAALNEFEDPEHTAEVDELAVAIRLTLDSLALLRRALDSPGAAGPAGDGARALASASSPFAASDLRDRRY